MSGSFNSSLILQLLDKPFIREENAILTDFYNDYYSVSKRVKRKIIDQFDLISYGSLILDSFIGSSICSSCDQKKNVFRRCIICDETKRMCKSCYGLSDHQLHEFTENYMMKSETLELYCKNFLLLFCEHLFLLDGFQKSKNDKSVLYLKYKRKVMDLKTYEVALKSIDKNSEFDYQKVLLSTNKTNICYLFTGTKKECAEHKETISVIFSHMQITEPFIEIISQEKFNMILFMQSFLGYFYDNFTEDSVYSCFKNILFQSRNETQLKKDPEESIFLYFINNMMENFKFIQKFIKNATAILLQNYDENLSLHFLHWFKSTKSNYGENFKTAYCMIKIIVATAMNSEKHLKFYLNNNLLYEAIVFTLPTLGIQLYKTAV